MNRVILIILLLLGTIDAGTIINPYRFGIVISPCTSSGSWTATGTTSTITATSRTITVPSGNSGKLTLNATATGCTQQYSLNGGTYTTFTSGTIITMTNGQTLNFRITGSGSGSFTGGEVDDFDTGTFVGTIDISNTS